MVRRRGYDVGKWNNSKNHQYTAGKHIISVPNDFDGCENVPIDHHRPSAVFYFYYGFTIYKITARPRHNNI